MNTKNLKQLFTLRMQEKAIKAGIESIKAEALKEAQALCPDGGKFSVEGVGDFVLDKVPVFDLTDFRKYKDELAKLWRQCFKKREKHRIESAAQTKLMGGYLKSFVKTTDKDPESYDYNLKCVE